MMSKSLPAIILAAGESSRLGQAKALVVVQESPLLKLITERLHSEGCDPIIVVTRAELSFDCLAASPNCKVVINKFPESGRTGTIQVGLIAIGQETGNLPKSALIVPVDRPGWSQSTLRKLLDAEGCVCPEKGGIGGHPLRVGSKEIEEILAAPSDQSLRQLVNPERFEVEDSFLHLNLDTSDDLDELERWAIESDGLF